MGILDVWNYPVSSFLRLLTPLYTEREKETVIGDCGEENRGDEGDRGTRVRRETRETGKLG